jgi:MoxR-like ATPase
MNDRDEIARSLAAGGYIADGELATAVSLMQRLKRPLLLEGEAGVGKTEVAKALAKMHATELIRLQCYEGLDQSAALYEWNYQRQLLAIQAHRGEQADSIEDQIFSEKYLLERPLLAAIRRDKAPVLLIDEIDRADDEFEAFLLELLSDFQVSIPELGTIAAVTIPHVILTSNAASITTSIIPTSIARPASSWRGSMGPAPRCRCRSRAWSKASARRNCARCRASPRRWTGRRRWSGSTCAICTMRRKSCTKP